MSACPLIVELVVVFILTGYLLNKYGNWRKQHVIVTLSTFIGWYFSFIIIFVLPLDVSITFYKRCELERTSSTVAVTAKGISNSTILPCDEPGGYVQDGVLLSLWRVVYWTAQSLTWIVLPLMQSYVNAGDFNTCGRLKAALLNNAIYYGVYLLIFIIILVYAIIKGVVINAEHLKIILISASNTWGLFLLVLLLGYGLVEMPRCLYHMGSRNYRLNKAYFNIDKLSCDKNDAEDGIKETYRESRSVLNILKNEHGARDKAQIIVSKFPEEVIDELFPVRNPSEFSGSSDIRTVNTDKYLIRLHKRVIAAIQAHHRTSDQWKSLIEQTLFLEDVAQAEITGRLPIRGYSILPDKLRHIWFVVAQRPLCKIFGLLLAAMTCFIVLSECTFFIIHPTLSPAAILIQYAADRFHYKYTQFVAIGIICYVCCCAYFTIFRLKIYKYYHLDANKHTDENSLLFSAILLCRLTPPICLNFLGMIHLDSHITQVKDYGVETQFTKLMGHLDLIPILAKGINVYLPIGILIFCAVNYYKLGTRILHSLGFDQFITDDEFTQDMVSAGKAIVNLERNRINRLNSRERREEEWAGRTATRPTFGRIRGGHSRLAEDEQPIVGAEEVDELSDIRIDSNNIYDSSSRREHPLPSHIFDDM